MTPREQAIELYNETKNQLPLFFKSEAKKRALNLISVILLKAKNTDYWKEVKKELEKL